MSDWMLDTSAAEGLGVLLGGLGSRGTEAPQRATTMRGAIKLDTPAHRLTLE